MQKVIHGKLFEKVFEIRRRYDATNDIFAENSWYFRNALVRANYTNLQKNVHETTVYLEKFIRNLLLGESNELKSRYLHISGIFDKNVGVNDKNVGVKLNKTQSKIVEEIIKSGGKCTVGDMAKSAGVERRTIERNIRTLKDKSIISRAGSDKKGHWLVEADHALYVQS